MEKKRKFNLSKKIDIALSILCAQGLGEIKIRSANSMAKSDAKFSSGCYSPIVAVSQLPGS
jgi:hypothetical protein